MYFSTEKNRFSWLLIVKDFDKLKKLYNFLAIPFFFVVIFFLTRLNGVE